MNKSTVKKIMILSLSLIIMFSFGCFYEPEASMNDDKNTQVNADEIGSLSEKEINNDKTKESDESLSNGSKTITNELKDTKKEENNAIISEENNYYEKPVQNPLPTPPKLKIQIIEGPVILDDNSLCYYRISARSLAYPQSVISFSKDDSLGAWGSNIVQINLLPDETYVLKIESSNSIGKTSADIFLNWQEAKIEYGNTLIFDDINNPKYYSIEVSLSQQKVNVFYKDELLKELVCSTGAPESPTPTGTFKTKDKIFYSWLPQYDVGAYYFVRFYNSYLFHSTPFDDEGNIITEDRNNLGKASSHGCIRFDLDDAKWFYEKLPAGIIVNIK